MLVYNHTMPPVRPDITGPQFIDPGELTDHDLRLVIAGLHAAYPALGFQPAYSFDMQHADTGVFMGSLTLRVGNTDPICRYSGHVGYAVLPEFRGRRLAERACRLILPLCAALGLDPLWITCDLDNLASRRTCERLGGEVVDHVRIPPEHRAHADGDELKVRYRLDLAAILARV